MAISNTGSGTEPFPSLDATLDGAASSSSPASPSAQLSPKIRSKSGSMASSLKDAARRLSEDFGSSNPPAGFMPATADLASTLTAGNPRRGPRGSDAPSPRESPGNALYPIPSHYTAPSTHGDRGTEPTHDNAEKGHDATELTTGASSAETQPQGQGSAHPEHHNTEPLLDQTEAFENGYHFPPKYPWNEATGQFLVSAWDYFTTPLGFFVVLYGLNVVAWGGMLFLLLCNASPAMCRTPENGRIVYDCNNINSPRRVWVEIDSQILNALFCVTGFGLIPWRFRDLYYLLKFRVGKQPLAWRRLAGIHRGWFRLAGSADLAPDVGPGHVPPGVSEGPIPFPERKIPDAPASGVRAPATATWKMDFVVWAMVWNTFIQGALSGAMWGMNRFNRPSWVTGFLVGLACVVAMLGGLMMFLEGKKVKEIEGVPLTPRDLERLARDRALGIPHYNNLSDKAPKEKAAGDTEPGTRGLSRSK